MGKPYRDLWYEVTSFANLLRGGSWGSSVDLVRSACRDPVDPDSWDSYIGFRCVRSQ
jgi:formylglycine-generating enzyme required for sulfatase activity